MPIDFTLAQKQHENYERSLAELGCTVQRLPVEPELPDAVFVEDTCVVLDELAIITRPGTESRRSETVSMADALQRYRPLRFVPAPGTLDGGDVLVLGRRIFVGMSQRTNASAIDYLCSELQPLGFQVTAVPVQGCLHLKSAVTQVGENSTLVNPDWVDPKHFAPATIIEVDPAEPFAANALLVKNTLIYPAAFPKSRQLLEQRGFNVRTFDVSEFAKAEGGVTCCCVIVMNKE